MPRKAKAPFNIAETPFVAKPSTSGTVTEWQMPTVSVLESEMGVVQGDDLTEPPIEAPAAPPEPEQPPAPPPGHALDLAPVNSKIVVTVEGAFLAGPDGPVALEKTDPANRLPVGAKIIKTRDGFGIVAYVSTQLSPVQHSEPGVYPSTLQAIKAFVEHHHPTGLHGN